MEFKLKHAVFASGYLVTPVCNRYTANDRWRIDLLDVSDGVPVVTATINLTDQECPEGCVFIKTWGENEGLLRDLVENQVVQPIGHRTKVGANIAELCKLLIDPK